MKTAATTLIISLSLFFAAQSQAEEHFIYRNASGKLVISNKTPPPGSEVLKKLDLTEGKQPGEDREARPNGSAETPKPPSHK